MLTELALQSAVWLAVVAFIPLSAQACEGTYRGLITQSFGGGSQEGDIELIVKDGQVSGFIMGHAQKIKRPVSGSVDISCHLIDTSTQGLSGRFNLVGTVTEGTGKSSGGDPIRLAYKARKVN